MSVNGHVVLLTNQSPCFRWRWTASPSLTVKPPTLFRYARRSGIGWKCWYPYSL